MEGAASTNLVWVAAFNGGLALIILWLALGMWRWRSQLQLLTVWLEQQHLSPQQMGYAIALQRAQVVSARLSIAQWQLLTRQLAQWVKLLRLLRWILIYRMRKRALSKR